MKTKLSLALLALLPFAAFGQSVAKKSVHPMQTRAVTAPASIKATANSPMAYCVPVDLDCTDGDLMTNVTFGTINNTSTCGTGGYNDFTAMSTEVTAGAVMPFSVTVGSGWFEKVSVWVDWNNNETFEPSELLSDPAGGIGGGGQGVTLTSDLTIPATVTSGSYRMRAVLVAVGSTNPAPDDPCVDGNYGEVEDYTLTVAATATGCLDAPNGQYPSGTFTPVCNASAEAITTSAWTGEYSKVNVTAGTAYTFGASIATHFITISDEAGTTVFASGTGSVQYTPTATGVVRFYTHLSSNCDSINSGLFSRTVMCGTPPVEPDYGCDQTYDDVWDLANNVWNGGSYFVANDFFVPKESGTYKIQSIKASVVPLNGQADIQAVTVKILSDNAGTPGAVVHSIDNAVPVITPLPDTFAGYATFDITVDMGNYELPVNAAADTRYWISLQVNGTQSTYWIGYKYTEGWVTKPNYQSVDNGATYTIVTYAPAPGQHYDSNWSIDADCAIQAVTEAGNKQVSFYPNPVKDFLNINAKSKVETVHVYNVAGQKMPVASTLVNGRIDMSKLAPGMYIISTILEGGVNESFKVIKK